VEINYPHNMIKETLQQIITNLNGYLSDHFRDSSYVEYTVLSHLSEGNESIHMNLINIEEDKVYKNHLNPIPNRLHDSTDDIHPFGGIPTIRVNLYVLFAFNPNTGQDTYLKALTLLTSVLSYFAATPYQEIVIPSTTIPAIPPTNDPTTIPEKRFTVEINYHNINLEDSNNMWSNLGGEQKPYAMYQIKMLEIEGDTHVSVVHDKVLREPVISSPEYDSKGKTVFVTDTNDANYGKPQHDTNEIKHIKTTTN